MKLSRRSKELLYRGLLLLLVCALAGLAGWGGWLARPENLYYDLWHQLAGVRYQPQHVVIVALDDETLDAFRDDPLVCWTPHFARAIRVLRQAGAGIIGIDFLYQISIEAWLRKLNLPAGHPARAFDAPFKEQLASGRVILAGSLMDDVQGKRKVVLPLPEYFAALPRGLEEVGLINLQADPDGVTRRFQPVLTADDGTTLFTLAKLLAVWAAHRDPALELRHLKKDATVQKRMEGVGGRQAEAAPIIGFVGPPGTFPRISMGRLLTPGAAQASDIQGLKGKVVIVAHESAATQDLHLTPYAQGFWSHPAQDMSGAEVHANIVETLLTGRFPRPVPEPFQWVYWLAVIAASQVLFFRLSPWRGLAALLALGLLCAVLAYVLFRGDWLLPLANAQLGLILSFIGILGLKLTGEERERARLRRMFGRYVADEIVEKLLAAGDLPDLGGEAFQVTVLFTDIRNFTTMAEGLAPQQVVEMLNTYFTRVCEPILEQGGTVDKFIGDAVMAVFGAPAPYPDHARRALRAALAIAALAREFQDWMAQRFPDRGLPEFHIGIGLHTGEAIVGNIGSPKRLEYTAIGDTVNTASRLEGLTKELGWTIVASRETIQAAGTGAVDTGGRAEVQVKGRQAPVEVFEVLAVGAE